MSVWGLVILDFGGTKTVFMLPAWAPITLGM